MPRGDCRIVVSLECFFFFLKECRLCCKGVYTQESKAQYSCSIDAVNDRQNQRKITIRELGKWFIPSEDS